MIDIFCPECDAVLDDEIDVDFDEGDEINCPKCGAELVMDGGSLALIEDEEDEELDYEEYDDDEDDDDDDEDY